MTTGQANTNVPTTVYYRLPGAPTWQIEEILRGIGFPDLLRDQMDGHFELIQNNLVSYSEDLSNTTFWENNSLSQYRYFDANLSASIQDLTVQQVQATRDPDNFWLTFAEQAGNLAQNVAVAPGEVYAFSFYAAPVADNAAARLSVVDIDSGDYLIPPLNYASQLEGGGFRRIVVAFQTPLTCTFVRLEVIAGADSFTHLDTDEGAGYAEYQGINPAHFDYSTQTLTIGDQVITIPLATPQER